jgi:hypothetical protein
MALGGDSSAADDPVGTPFYLCLPLLWGTVGGDYYFPITHFTVILYNIVLHVSVHQNHHWELLLQKSKNICTFATFSFFVSENSLMKTTDA